MNRRLPIPVFAINLAEDVERRKSLADQFRALHDFALRFVPAVDGRKLPTTACFSLTQDMLWSRNKGTIGCFLSHVSAWNAVAESGAPIAVVLEDDVDVASLPQLTGLALPEDADLVFLNERVSICDARADLAIRPLWQALLAMDRTRSGPGGDGYLLSSDAAKRLISTVKTDLFYGHVDGRLLRYAASKDDLDQLPGDSWIGHVIRTHHHPALRPPLGLVKGYCLSRPLIRHRGIGSSRESADGGSLVTMTTADVPPRSPMPAPEATYIPVRYWNRIDNIGDLINPHVIRLIAGREPLFVTDDQAPHLLGVGSIMFMATKASTIWGSGILNPSDRLDNIDPQRVLAVRGKFTLEVLRRQLGVSSDIALGDPGVFITEVPAVQQMLATAKTKRRVALVPHYAMLGSEWVAQMQAGLDAVVVNPKTRSLDFLHDLAESEIVVSQSLHGLIFAEALGKRSVWISQSFDDVWLFKFRDWFSNTVDPHLAPLAVDTPAATILAAARRCGLAINFSSLRDALPSGLGLTPDRDTLSFEFARRFNPLVVAAMADTGSPRNTAFDETIYYTAGDEQALQESLNAISHKFAEPPKILLAFDQQLLRKLPIGVLETILDQLTEQPTLHYVCVLDAAAATVPERVCRADLLPIDLRHAWQGLIVMRHGFNFAFSAPGLVRTI